MKRIIFSLALLIGLSTTSFAQTTTKIGVGYFGETVVYGGAVVELEIEQQVSPSTSLPLRIDIGYFSHPRNQTGVFLDVNYGFRKYFKSGFFLEESIGIGVLQTILNGEDGVFELGEDGTFIEGSKFNKPDLMPSITLGVGYQMKGGKGLPSSIWLRPKIYWQYPEKLKSVFHLAVQVGVSWDL